MKALYFFKLPYLLLIFVLCQVLSPLRVLAEIPDNIDTLTKNEMSEVLPYAIMSSLAYEKLNPAYEYQGWKWLDLASENGFTVASFRNDNRKEVVISFAGTDSLSDFIDDIVQASGGLDNQYNRGLSSAMAFLINEFKSQNYQVILTGHSLGGGIAQYAAEVLGLKAYTFNPAPLNDVLIDETIAVDILIKEQANILNIVSYDEYDQYDIVASSPGDLYGITKRLEVETSRFNIFERHSIDTIIDTIENAGIKSDWETAHSAEVYSFDLSLGPEVWSLNGDLLYSNQWYYSYQTDIVTADWIEGAALSVQGNIYSNVSKNKTFYYGANQVYYTLPPGAELIAIWSCRYSGTDLNVTAGSSSIPAKAGTETSLINATFKQSKAIAYQPLKPNYINSPSDKPVHDMLYYEEISKDYHCGYQVFGKNQ